MTLRMCLLTALALIGAMLAAPSAHAELVGSKGIQVVDGDTIDLRYRLVGFDTPETGRRAKCEYERKLAKRVSQRLTHLIHSSKSIELTEVRCSCKAGTHGTNECNSGRRCARLALDGTDVKTTLIAEGMAREYVCGEERCPARGSWCPEGKNQKH